MFKIWEQSVKFLSRFQREILRLLSQRCECVWQHKQEFWGPGTVLYCIIWTWSRSSSVLRSAQNRRHCERWQYHLGEGRKDLLKQWPQSHCGLSRRLDGVKWQERGELKCPPRRGRRRQREKMEKIHIRTSEWERERRRERGWQRWRVERVRDGES